MTMVTEDKNAIILSASPGLRESFKQALRKLNVNILVSSSNPEIILDELSYEDVHCEILIVDVQISGSILEFLAELRKMREFDNSAIYVTCANDEISLLKDCLPYGISNFVVKPFSMESFVETLLFQEELIRRFKNNIDALYAYNNARLCELEGDFIDAKKFMQKAFELTDDAQCCFDLSRYNTFTKNTQEAVKQFKIALSKDESLAKKIADFTEKHLTQVSLESHKKVPFKVIKLFKIPIAQFTKKFYGLSDISKGALIGGNHGERSNLKNSLINLGVKKVEVFASDEDAFDRIKIDFSINLVICWLETNDNNGLKLVQNLRKLNAGDRLKILVVINPNDISFLNEGILRGVDGYLLSPITQDHLCQRLHMTMLVDHFTRHTEKSQKHLKCAFHHWEQKQYHECLLSAQLAENSNLEDGVANFLQGLAYLAMNKLVEARRQLDFAQEKNQELELLIQELPFPKANILKDGKEGQEKINPKEMTPVPSPLNHFAMAVENAKKQKEEVALPKDRKRKKKEDSRKLASLGDLTSPSSDASVEDTPIPSLVPAEEKTSESSSNEDLHHNENFETKAEVAKTTIKPAKKSGITKEVLEEMGIVEANSIQAQGVEQIIGSGSRKKMISGGRIIEIEDGEVRPWLPTAVLRKEATPTEVKNYSPGKTIKAWDDEVKPFLENISVLSGQAQLLHTRIVCEPADVEMSDPQKAYLKKVAEVFSSRKFIENFASNDSLSDSILEKVEKIYDGNASDQDYQKLGYELIHEGIVDEFFSQAYDYRRLEAHEIEDPNKLHELQYTLESLSEITDPMIRFHRECLQGHNAFENTLPYAIETACENRDFQPLYKALEEDHFSLEAWKKVYGTLKNRGEDQLVEKLMKIINKKYQSNDRVQNLLGKFMLTQGNEDAAEELLMKNKSHRTDYKALSLIYYSKDRMKDTLECCQILVKKGKDLEHAYNLMGVVYKRCGHLKLAIKTYRKGIHSVPESIKLHHNLAIALFKSGEKEKAKSYSRKAKFLKAEQNKVMSRRAS